MRLRRSRLRPPGPLPPPPPPLMRPGAPPGGGRLGDFADLRLPGYCFFPTGEITISFFVLSTIAKSSFCSWSGTLNLSRTFLKSAPIACHSFSVMLRCWWDSFIPLPVYFSGPPVDWHTREVTWYLRYALGTRSLASLIFGVAFRRSSW